MIATLILFTAGRSIAAWINNNELPVISDPSFKYYGEFIPGIPIPTPVFIAIACIVVIGIVLKVTNLRIYTGGWYQPELFQTEWFESGIYQGTFLRDSWFVRGSGGSDQSKPYLFHQLFRHCKGYRDGCHSGSCPWR